MQLNTIQETAQRQKLLLTPEMRQSLKILQMPLSELQHEVMRELDENPLLEVASNEESKIDAHDQKDENVAPKTRADTDEERWLQNIVKNAEDREYSGIDHRESADLFNLVVAKRTLKDYLKEQLLDLNEPESMIAICDYIIENIDERGYLSCPVAELAADLQVPPKRLEYALELVQEFQPWGVAARDLKECLTIQLWKKQLWDEAVGRMVTQCLELIAANKVREIARELELDLGEVRRYCQIIRSLEPKPARGFFTGNPDCYIVPEAYIIKSAGQLVILMNDNILPKLTVNGLYQKIIKQHDDVKNFGYVKAKVNSAMLLIKGIEHRKMTLYNILDQIVALQKDYFCRGEANLKPMSIAEIAGGLNIHESTVSRAIRDKYISTPFKTVKLKDLFSGALGLTATEESISVKLVKKKIQQLIAGENKTKPLSDQDICNILKRLGIVISRRTVAKYREAMAIGSSAKRRM
jgi:RNA polymerase sigma-54 factor